jgi:hypothetical protein
MQDNYKHKDIAYMGYLHRIWLASRYLAQVAKVYLLLGMWVAL